MGAKDKVIKAVAAAGVKIVGDVAVKAIDSFAKHGTNAVAKQVTEKKKTTVRIPSGAVEYFHRDYQEVKTELEAYGFTNITLVERKDLMMGLLTKAGAIEEISIDGKADFKKNTKYRSDARVVIIYHTFKIQN